MAWTSHQYVNIWLWYCFYHAAASWNFLRLQFFILKAVCTNLIDLWSHSSKIIFLVVFFYFHKFKMRKNLLPCSCLSITGTIPRALGMICRCQISLFDASKWRGQVGNFLTQWGKVFPSWVGKFSHLFPPLRSFKDLATSWRTSALTILPQLIKRLLHFFERASPITGIELAIFR